MNDRCRFDPASVGAFRVTRWSFDEASRTVSLRYGFDDGPDFVETITFETVPTRNAPAGTGPEARLGLGRALLHLHIAAGTSYYKTAAPDEVVIEDSGVTSSALEFHRHLYDDGLREFAVSNRLVVPRPVTLRPIRLEPSVDRSPATDRSGGGGLLVPIGGGKDSMVVIDAVRHLNPLLLAVNPHPLVLELADQVGLELVVVRRRLAPNLVDLNGAGALNGHVPITAIISLIAVAGSFLYGYDTMAMAVERSASEETVVVDGTPVNHQYSKSLAFERQLQTLIASDIDSNLRYGSVLRPYSELAIARTFAGLTQYHSTFCSCNTVFRQTAGAEDRWCGSCPKCRFVGLMLAPFLAPDEVAGIIGRDMFADPEQVPGFAALMSRDDKPFECVGERRESAAAMRLISFQAGWSDKPVVKALSARARAMVSDDDVTALLTPSGRSEFGGRELASAVDRRLTVTS